MSEKTSPSNQGSIEDRTFSLKSGAGVLLLVVVLGGGGYFYWKTQQQNVVQQAFWTEYQEVTTNLHRSGKNDEAIAALQEFLNKEKPFDIAQQKSIDSRLRMRLAANYIARNSPGDYQEAMKLYNSVINDETYDPVHRAIAMGEMASVTHWISGPEEVRKIVFSEAPYADVLVQRGGDIHAAISRLYEMSNEIHPNALANFQIALMQAIHLVNMPEMSFSEKESQAKAILTLIREADTIVGEFPYEKSYLAHMYLCRSMSLSVVGRILDKEVSVQEVEQSFAKAQSIAAEGADDFYARSVGITNRLYYAQYLNNNKARFPEPRTAELRQQLSGYTAQAATNPEYRIINAYLAGVANRSDSDFFKNSMKSLAKEAPSFGEYLTALGWKLGA